MSEPASEPGSTKTDIQYVEGFPIPIMFSADCLRSALKLKPQEGDVFIVTYPKCGTTWTHHMLGLIRRLGEPTRSATDFFNSAPFLEVTGGEALENIPRPGVFKTHIPFRLIPWSDKAKYIHVVRNPKDCCVSFYHHMKNLPGHNFNGTFDEFFEMFVTGEVAFGDYFDHLLGWYEHRNDPNVLFITYEEMKENTEAAILKIASFVDDKLYAEPLRNDRQKLDNVIKYSGFQYMKEKVSKDMDELLNMSKEELENSDLPSETKKIIASRSMLESVKGSPSKSDTSPFVRKGIIGDWKNYFNEDQERRLKAKFAERTKGTDIPNLFMKYM